MINQANEFLTFPQELQLRSFMKILKMFTHLSILQLFVDVESSNFGSSLPTTLNPILRVFILSK